MYYAGDGRMAAGCPEGGCVDCTAGGRTSGAEVMRMFSQLREWADLPGEGGVSLGLGKEVSAILASGGDGCGGERGRGGVGGGRGGWEGEPGRGCVVASGSRDEPQQG